MTLVGVIYCVAFVLLLVMAGPLPILQQLALLGALLLSGLISFGYDKVARSTLPAALSQARSSILLATFFLWSAPFTGLAPSHYLVATAVALLLANLRPSTLSADRATFVLLGLGFVVLLWAQGLLATLASYAAIATAVVALLAGLAAAERARYGRGSRPLIAADFKGLDWPKLALVWVMLLAVSEIIPSRNNADQMEPFRQEVGPVTGFTDRVNLNFFGELKNDDRRALIVRISSEESPWSVDDYNRRAPFPMLMRGAVATSYSNGYLLNPTRDAVPEPRPVLLNEAAHFQTLIQDIVAAPHGGRHLFSLGYATGASTGLDVEYGLVSAPIPFEEAKSYRVYARVQRHTGRLALKRELIPHKNETLRARIPLSPEAQLLARELWKQLSAENMYDRIMALESWFQFGGSFRYSRRNENDPSDPVSDFLVSNKAGPCSYFAVAMVAVLREWGYPARVAMGFRDGTYSPANEALVFLQRNAHAWVEVPFHQSGWVSFDPTPPETRLDAISDPVSLEGSAMGGAGGPVDSEATLREKPADPGFLRRFWSLLVLSFIFSALLAKVLKETLQSAGVRRAFQKEVEALDAWFRREGAPRNKSQTFHEVARILPNLNPSTEALLNRVLRYLDRIRYSERLLGAEDMVEFKASLSQLTRGEQAS